jgi:hypothetical protein
MRYIEMDMRGSGIYSSDEEVAIDPCTVCGSHDGILYTDDWGTQTLSCLICDTEQPLPEPDEPDREDWLDAKWDDFRDGAADPDW